MKTKINGLLKIIFSLAVGIFSHSAFSQTMIQSKINAFEYKNCLKNDKCIVIHADIAESGQFSQIFALKKYSVKVLKNQFDQSVLKKFEGNFGYLDMDTEYLVLTQADKNEVVINLVNLKMSGYLR